MNDKVRAWIVDDDQLIQATVEDVLFEGGFDPVLTDSGEEAIALLKDEKNAVRAVFRLHRLFQIRALRGRSLGGRDRAAATGSRPFKQALRQGFPDPQRHRVGYSGGRLS